jgi:outer membrane lipoprotein-sorting protein
LPCNSIREKEAFIMKKIIFILILSAFCISRVFAVKPSSPAVFSHIPYKSAVWKSKTTVQSPDETITFDQTTYFKENKMRTEGIYVRPGTKEKENQIIIINTGRIYMINPGKKQGMLYKLGGKNNPKMAEESFAKCRQNGKKIGSESINGANCDIYQYNCDISSTPVEVKEWRNTKDGFIMKTLSIMNKMTTTVDIISLKPNADIPDSKFVPDPSIKFMDMEKMMNGKLPGMMNK